MNPYSWDELRAASLWRQFPPVRGRDHEAVTELVRRAGPIQSQVARSPFVMVSSRLPGTSYADITAAYESFAVVRGSSIRGTIHTCVKEQHPWLDAITRRTLRLGWTRNLGLKQTSPGEVQAAIEAFASGAWRTPDELRAHLVSWLRAHEGATSAELAHTTGVGRAFAHIHSALIRRPLGDTGWDRQGHPGYRVAADVLSAPPSPLLGDPDMALVKLTRQHLSAFGPANRRDIAWWSGDGLRNVERALGSLADELTVRPGPDGQMYYDLIEASGGGAGDPGVRLLPEFDAVLVGYDPKTRDRFLDPSHLPHIWLQQNGTLSSAVLAEGRLVASWHFDRAARERCLDVRMFPGLPVLTESDLSDQVTALEQALAIRVTDLRISR